MPVEAAQLEVCMRNLKIDGEDFVYDCDGVGCTTPGEPHRVPIKAVMASLEATFREFAFHKDPRLETLDVTLQFMFQNLFPAGATGEPRPAGKQVEWFKEFRALTSELDDHYGVSDDALPPKDYLN